MPNANPNGRPRQLASIQYLRAIAAALIAYYHIGGVLERLQYPGVWSKNYQTGVDIFLVISGFVMWHSTVNRNLSPLKFFAKRVERVVPLYWAVTSVVVAMLIFVPSAVLTGHFDLKHVVLSYLFLPAVHPVTGFMYPVLIPGWTLNLEMYFYFLFGLCLLLPVAARIPATVALLLIPMALQHMVHTPDTALLFYGNTIVLDFAYGLILGAVTVSGRKLAFPVAILAVVAGIAGMAFIPFITAPRGITIGLPALAIVAGMLGIEQAGRLPTIRGLEVLGDASYSLYLSQSLTLSALGQLVHRLGMSASTQGGLIAVILLLWCGTLIVGILVYQWVERPLIRFFARRGVPTLEARQAA